MITSALISTAIFLNLALIPAKEFKRQVDPSVFKLTVFHADGQQSSGTGFVISETGLMVTNNHVIDGAINIIAEDDKRSRVSVKPGFYARNSKHDIALIQLDLSGAPRDFALPALTLAPDTVEFSGGEDVYVLGHPSGLDIAEFTAGRISAVEDKPRRLRFDARISQGSSGSPLFDATTGDVIGIVTSYYKGGQETNYATPVEYLHELRDSLDTSPRLLPYRTPADSRGSVLSLPGGSLPINLLVSLIFFVALGFGLKKVFHSADN